MAEFDQGKICKSFIFGAKGVFMGRPYMYGLAAKGKGSRKS